MPWSSTGCSAWRSPTRAPRSSRRAIGARSATRATSCRSRRMRPSRVASARSVGTTRASRRNEFIIVDGTFQDFISSRETAGAIGGTSTGAMRADGWQNLPLIRMTNINIEPGEGSLADIIGDTRDGIFMATNQSWSIDDKRVNFQFGCEIAWRIKDGKRMEMYRNPNYTGITTEFWGSCDAVGGREEWTLWGTPNCGKGQPGQVARVGHGTPPARFRNVQVGVR